MTSKKEQVSSNGGREIHAILTVDDTAAAFAGQLREISEAFGALMRDAGERMKPVFCRWFLSDTANQAPLLPQLADCAVSVVEQAPLSLTKAALWVWLMEDVEVERIDEGVYAVRSGAYTHIFEAGRCRAGEDSEAATYDVLRSTERLLQSRGVNIIGNCVRTWFFVQNVDVNYAGVVEGRNRAFRELGLTPATRFIASTGIGGRHADRKVKAMMDSYSVIPLEKGQMRQVNAPEYLNPTYEYGVAFERAASVDYGDRRHLFISGTASIDNRGEILWEGDIRRQTLRMWTNVEALLKAADCSWEDVGQMLVYLRDPADYPVVKAMYEERFPDTPHVIVLAPVCRPGWLIEMECMAMKPVKTDFVPL